MDQKCITKFFKTNVAMLILCIYCGISPASYAQWDSDTKKSLPESKIDLKSTLQMPSSTTTSITNMQIPNVLPLESLVDPDVYYIGPSDLIAVNIWTSPQLALPLAVTPEGTLIIPTVGEVQVADITLSEAKKKVIKEIKKKYISGNPTVTLLNPRQIIVTVTGAVRNPGKYVVSATDRADYAILLANKKQKDVLSETKEINLGKEIRKDISTQFDENLQTKRNIRITRHTGEIIRADIIQYYATRNSRWNPFLREGDEIFVPRIDPKKNAFGIYGGVNVQGTFELTEGDSILGAIGLANGFTSRAITDSIMLYRYDSVNERQVVSTWNYDQVKQGLTKNYPLLPGDRIIVQERPDIREDYHVFLEGEVRYPGTYPITKGNTKLSQVIEWAGGLTEYASLSAAQIIHSPLSYTDQQFDRIRGLRGGGIPEDTNYYAIESNLSVNYQEVNVNFIDLFAKKDTMKDIILQDGDWIRIPTIQNSVYVFGQVVFPGNIPFVKGEGLKYYIKKAGGYTENARSSDVTVIKRASRQWLSPSDTEIEEGDYIWIPKTPDRTFSYYMTIGSQAAAIISTAVSVVLVIIQIRLLNK